MLLPVDADASRACTACGHPRIGHSSVAGCMQCACKEFRSSPEDSVLTCVLRCLRLDVASPQAQEWVERLRQAHIPLEMPAERWLVDLTRVLVAHGVVPQQTRMLNDPLALAIGTRQPCLQTSVNGMENSDASSRLP